jgi:hypothetical protein
MEIKQHNYDSLKTFEPLPTHEELRQLSEENKLKDLVSYLRNNHPIDYKEMS